MGARGRTCPDCRRTWPQRHARFCGTCGGRLGDAPPPERTERRTLSSRTGIALALVALLVVGVTALSLDPPRQPPATVEVADGILTAPNPLSDEQMELLRDQADPGRLRCAPRGCERWRFDREGGPMASGAVQLGDGLVLVMVGTSRGGRPPITEETDEPAPTHRLVAIDPDTGEQRWQRPVGDYPSISGAYQWVQLLDGPEGGALIVSGTTVTALDQDGDQRWTATPAIGSGPVREIQDAATTDHGVLLSSAIPSGSPATHHLTALDPRTGAARWAADVGQVAALQDEQAIVIDPDGTVRALHAATGEPRWSRAGAATHARLAGPWLAVQEGARLHLVDPDTGQERGTAEVWLTSPLVSAGERWVGTGRTTGPDADVSVWADEAGSMELVAFDADAQLLWNEPLGHIRPWWDCCPVRVDPDERIVTVDAPSRSLMHDLDTGRIRDAEATGRDDATADRGLMDAAVQHADSDVEVAISDGGRRLELHTPGGEVTVTSDHEIRLESVEPLVVADERELIGIGLPTTP